MMGWAARVNEGFARTSPLPKGVRPWRVVIAFVNARMVMYRSVVVQAKSKPEAAAKAELKQNEHVSRVVAL